jgi:uncharacterized protein YjfI (DUF2170 family)
LNIHNIAEHLNALSYSDEGVTFDCQPITGEVDVLQVSIINREELSIFISVTDTQILFITYLWDINDIKSDKKSKMHEVMLEMNIPIPLSSLSITGNKYVLFGKTAISSSYEDITYEIITLSNNAPDVIEYFKDYFN